MRMGFIESAFVSLKYALKVGTSQDTNQCEWVSEWVEYEVYRNNKSISNYFPFDITTRKVYVPSVRRRV